MSEERASTVKETQDHQVMVSPMLRSSHLFLWLEWVVATMLAFALGQALRGFTVAFWHYESIIGWTVTGFLMGSAQWMVLRKRVRGGGWWILASVVGCSVGGSMLDIVLKATSGIVGGAVSGAALGIALGLAQRGILRVRVSRAGWWILSNAVGWCVGWCIGRVAVQIAMGKFGIVWGLMSLGAVGGAITGISLIGLLWSSLSEA